MCVFVFVHTSETDVYLCNSAQSNPDCLCIQSAEREEEEVVQETVTSYQLSAVSATPVSSAARQDSESGLETWIKHDR